MRGKQVKFEGRLFMFKINTFNDLDIKGDDRDENNYA